MLLSLPAIRSVNLTLGILLLPAFLLPAAAQTALQPISTPDTPRDWLTRMAQAVEQRNYAGTFVYSHDDELEAMRLVHRADENGGAERLVSLSGEPREIIRDGNVVKCFLPGREAVIVARGETAMPLPASQSLEDPALQKHYEFIDMGESRVAGRDCKIIGIKPRDEFRYGYRLCLDKKTALPLKSELMSPTGEVIEQVMFTRLELPDSIPGKALKAQVAADGFTWHVRHGAISPEPLVAEKSDTQTDAGAKISVDKRLTPAWQAEKLPPGFIMTHNSMERDKETPRNPKTHSWHMVYSDGLASVSVFVEPADVAHKTLTGVAHLGAVNAYGRQLENWQLTVVGEVPAKT
ncbi:MAG TPA: MucB/RseB C-terminal domain-containing protein, partial [Gammaproteobacteria bacterium]|nr:MucB/RseB C-terminal domain-containing protein [Gammaproteobacteria bacterium]